MRGWGGGGGAVCCPNKVASFSKFLMLSKRDEYLYRRN